MYSDSMKEVRLSTGRKVVVDYDESTAIDSPRNWGPVTKLVGLSKTCYNVFDETFDSILELYDERDKALREGAFVFNLYMYKHRCIVLSVYPFADKWDSSQIGFCIVQKNTKNAREVAESELTVFNKWLNGEVFEVLVAHPDGFDTVIDDYIGGCFIDNEDDLRDVLDGLDLTEGERREALDNLDKLMP